MDVNPDVLLEMTRFVLVEMVGSSYTNFAQNELYDYVKSELEASPIKASPKQKFELLSASGEDVFGRFREIIDKAFSNWVGSILNEVEEYLHRESCDTIYSFDREHITLELKKEISRILFNESGSPSFVTPIEPAWISVVITAMREKFERIPFAMNPNKAFIKALSGFNDYADERVITYIKKYFSNLFYQNIKIVE